MPFKDRDTFDRKSGLERGGDLRCCGNAFFRVIWGQKVLAKAPFSLRHRKLIMIEERNVSYNQKNKVTRQLEWRRIIVV
jgi:hypothetical protein